MMTIAANAKVGLSNKQTVASMLAISYMGIIQHLHQAPPGLPVIRCRLINNGSRLRSLSKILLSLVSQSINHLFICRFFPISHLLPFKCFKPGPLITLIHHLLTPLTFIQPPKCRRALLKRVSYLLMFTYCMGSARLVPTLETAYSKRFHILDILLKTPRKMLIGQFRELGDTHPLVPEYRKRLARAFH